MKEQTLKTEPDYELFYTVIKMSPIGIAVENLEGQPVFVNPAFCAMLGFSQEEMLRRHGVDFSPAEDSEKDWALFQQLRTGAIDHYQLDKRYLRRDGSLIWGRLRISMLNYGPSPLVVALVEEITDRKHVEDALREGEERFRLVANTAPVMIWMIGADQLCTYVNQRWLEFTGTSFNSQLGSGWADEIHPEDRSSCLETLTRAFERQEKFRAECRLRRHDGEYRWILDTGVPRFDSSSSFTG